MPINPFLSFLSNFVSNLVDDCNLLVLFLNSKINNFPKSNCYFQFANGLCESLAAKKDTHLRKDNASA